MFQAGRRRMIDIRTCSSEISGMQMEWKVDIHSLLLSRHMYSWPYTKTKNSQEGVLRCGQLKSLKKSHRADKVSVKKVLTG